MPVLSDVVLTIGGKDFDPARNCKITVHIQFTEEEIRNEAHWRAFAYLNGVDFPLPVTRIYTFPYKEIQAKGLDSKKMYEYTWEADISNNTLDEDRGDRLLGPELDEICGEVELIPLNFQHVRKRSKVMTINAK
jgi:hypothetical protein